MKAKEKQLIRERSYYSYLLTCLSVAFDWTVPDGVEPRYLEMFLHEQGSFGVQKQGNKYVIVPSPSRTAPLDQYGDGLTVYGVTLASGIQINGKYNEDCFVCYNNIDRMPDLDMVRYADAFSQVDKAIMANVRWTILAPILCANDSKITASVNKLIDDILDGKLKCITSKDVLDSLSGGNSNGFFSVDITHPERIKNVQYQSELYDVLFRRFFNKYGMNIQNTAKHAQTSVDEVHGLDSVSWIYILDMLNQRQRFCAEINKVYNDGWSVQFSDIWQKEYDKYTRQTEEQPNNETLIDGSEDDGNSEMGDN